MLTPSPLAAPCKRNCCYAAFQLLCQLGRCLCVRIIVLMACHSRPIIYGYVHTFLRLGCARCGCRVGHPLPVLCSSWCCKGVCSGGKQHGRGLQGNSAEQQVGPHHQSGGGKVGRGVSFKNVYYLHKLYVHTN